ncbi:endonuclease/exonuclease/phosphatase family protein [Sphingomonas montanisoli]|uniref:Endonuclease/exonuclease/phosphatase n=1 Tax=Sphingomonas montanisoli TaxID=2606412 RepID=A0A5D9C7V9_9SPHN|nr:endonuclease/exonuclease/phosphatase family protein [Sphingomonas montanisoli]TZG27789.1 endonuclease/exonuclease/phosphatase [Sphingomonas montanisoli]
MRAGLLAALAIVGSAYSSPISPGVQRLAEAAVAPELHHRADEISVLTYNVEALPWPINSGREHDLARIAERLRTLRRSGVAPHIVVLQEAFTPEARSIGRLAGYRYQAFGPAAEDARGDVPLPAAFVANRSWYLGERSDPVLSSGLAIFSDYPILATRSAPFTACAGFDCGANKGVLVATIAAPGVAEPIEVATTHLNCRKSSMTSPQRNLTAYRAQLDAVDRLMGGTKRVRLFAGDFNVHSIGRLEALQAHGRRWNMTPATAMGVVRKPAMFCGQGKGACGMDLPIASNLPLAHATDWQFFAGSAATDIRPVRRLPLFGREADGTMLSDHIGYSVVYRVSRRS